MSKEETKQRDRIFLRLYLKTSPDSLSEEDLIYFKNNPDAIDEVTAPVNIHKIYLWIGGLLGILLVGVSKWLKFGGYAIVSGSVKEFSVDIVFEIGVALIGAAVTAYILGILLNRQQEKAAHWRAEIRRKINDIK